MTTMISSLAADYYVRLSHHDDDGGGDAVRGEMLVVGKRSSPVSSRIEEEGNDNENDWRYSYCSDPP